MKQKYYLIGAYKEIPVYFIRNQGLMLGSRMDELVAPSAVQNLEIIRDLGGAAGIERIVNNYERTKSLRRKKMDYYKHKYELRTYIGQINNRPVYYDKDEGYSIESYSIGMRNPNHKEMRQIKAKYGN